LHEESTILNEYESSQTTPDLQSQVILHDT
jgi:hypothetical protein